MTTTTELRINEPGLNQFPDFTGQDFDVFAIPGLEPRMEALIANVRPKLEAIGHIMSPYLSALCGEEMFAHVAKHARRTVHPPNDTWVAWAPNKRGYKAHPHFQFGMWGSHIFIQFALIYESDRKPLFGERWLRHLDEITQTVPNDYVWSMDHMKPEAAPHHALTRSDFEDMAKRLKTVKSSELLCGIHIQRDDPAAADGRQLGERAAEVFDTLMPLYRLAVQD
ncbi:DUF1054 domain-containing protein [Xylanibacillus composti]|uniref:UPF0637 protein XYCOK13_11190 n=1 Tax=Xylanibacillus composti TaxID=1572762 RepID=A0A8J4M0Y6_9BACL|nr:DUF1054 domain-containing protein [Xylanibacillus composti]MDT9724190.1 DUF1054 domain-containing protein [Xylanibacillus composti]GIQ68295.1 UPF0637 protein [Xylanibacillus composti]